MRQLADMPPGSEPPDLLEVLAISRAPLESPPGAQPMRGEEVQGFNVATGTGRVSVFADVNTRLPSLVEVNAGAGSTTLFSDITWIPKIDSSAFALTAPEGFEMIAIKENLRDANEGDLLKALETAAELNGGKFPDEFTRAGMTRIFEARAMRCPERTAPITSSRWSSSISNCSRSAGDCCMSASRGTERTGDMPARAVHGLGQSGLVVSAAELEELSADQWRADCPSGDG